MSLPFDPDDVAFCEYMRNSTQVLGVTVHFKDGSSRMMQGEEITEELLQMCRSKKPPL
jgi:Tfp pilus assembly protein PilZ